jgi:acyl-CoA reductase-like NAD-dependent aldehyde dehydrogenase
VGQGAKVETGGGRSGALLEPTVMTGTRPGQKVNSEEVFAPLTTVTPCADFAEAIAMANDSPYGLQAGVFTRDIGQLMAAWHDLDVGGVIGNDIPGFRIDRMPYGGAKASGLGREGVRFAIDEMTELRILIVPGA